MIYWCCRCGDYREVPHRTPLYCCGELMEAPDDQERAKRLMDEQEGGEK